MTRELDIAWAAGIWEGEGCWSVSSRLTAGRHKTRMVAQSRLGMTDRDVVERFATIVGFGTVRTERRHTNRPKDKTMHTWYTQRRDKTRLLIEMFWPYLGERRRAKAQEVLDLGEATPCGERTTCPKGHPYDQYELVAKSSDPHYARRCSICRREECRNRMRRHLNILPERWASLDAALSRAA